MNNLLYSRLYNKILAALSEPGFLKKLEINEAFITKHLENKSYILKLQDMIKEKNFNSKEVLNLSIDMMNEITNNVTPKDWLEYIYQYTLSKSFPNSVEIELNETFDKAAVLYLKTLRIFSSIEKKHVEYNRLLKYPLIFLTGQEEKNTIHPQNIESLKKFFITTTFMK